MKPPSRTGISPILRALTLITGVALAPAVFGQQVTFSPYIQLGDNGPFGPTDQVVIAWQTDATSPKRSACKVEFQASERFPRSVTPKGRVIDNYLAADPSLPTIPGAYGAHSNYTAVLTGLSYDTQYKYRVTGPGMPTGGFASSFHTRKLGHVYSFVVVGDEGYFPTVPNSDPAVIVDYEARIAHLIHDAPNLSVPGVPQLPRQISFSTPATTSTTKAQRIATATSSSRSITAIRTPTRPELPFCAANCSSLPTEITTWAAPGYRPIFSPTTPRRPSAAIKAAGILSRSSTTSTSRRMGRRDSISSSRGT
jgi:hypothetical protein